MLKIVRAKLHGIRVTASDLDYHGSVTLDPEICAKAGIAPLEFVQIWNKNSGARITTYVIYGAAGSRCCILNGAAARSCQKGDEVIICASEYIQNLGELTERAPVVLCFDERNAITGILQYRVSRNESGWFNFETIELDSGLDQNILP